jgi:sulfopyruvate decarboxylase alpha subunit
MSAAGNWTQAIVEALRANGVRLVAYVPDRVLAPLIGALGADPFFTVFACAREEEAAGILSGAWLGGTRGVLLMQTSGFATLANVLASLNVAYRIPILMIVSERGSLAEFNHGQALVARALRPILDATGLPHHTLARLEDVPFVLNGAIKQAYATQEAVALILHPLLTGGKVFAEKGAS